MKVGSAPAQLRVAVVDTVEVSDDEGVVWIDFVVLRPLVVLLVLVDVVDGAPFVVDLVLGVTYLIVRVYDLDNIAFWTMFREHPTLVEGC